jgi:hypothetical protein
VSSKNNAFGTTGAFGAAKRQRDSTWAPGHRLEVTHMTTRTRCQIYVSAAAMMVTAALAAPAAAQASCEGLAPGCFKGSFLGQDTHEVLPEGATLVVITTTATGVGSRLGRFSLLREVTGNLVDFGATGSARWVAANGDSIETTVDGHAYVSDLPGGYLFVTEKHTIVGGTGRFTGAGGTFTVELFHRFEASSVIDGVEAHDVFGSFHGTITFRGASH